MAKKRSFISFDYDHDSDLKNLLVGQAKNSDSPSSLYGGGFKPTNVQTLPFSRVYRLFF